MKSWLCWITTVALTVSTAALAQTGPKLEQLCQGDKNLAKMSYTLLQARGALKRGKSLSAVTEKLPDHAVRDGKIQMLVSVTEISEGLLGALRDTGVDIKGTHSIAGMNYVVIQCKSPLQLDPIAEREDVRAIRLEPLARTRRGEVDNQADLSIRAQQARELFEVTGRGVRVGILSDSVNSVIGGAISDEGILTGASSQRSGDLPPEIRVIDPGPLASDEGAAMMELIYDLAPQCDFSFASAFTSYGAFASNIVNLANDEDYECDIICDDVFYFVEPIYQDGPIATAIDTVVASGVPYFSAAGNDADNAHERPFADSNPAQDAVLELPDGNDLHDFGEAYDVASKTHLEFTVQPGGSLLLILHWDEPYGGAFAEGPGASSDMDLFLVDRTDVPIREEYVLAAAADFQGTPGEPFGDSVEILLYSNISAAPETAYAVINHYAGREPRMLHLWALTDGASIDNKNLVQDRTIVGHPVASGAMAVGAMFFGEIDTGGAYVDPNGEFNVEPFSSLGGELPIYFSANGFTRYEEPRIRVKPEITAPDGTNTTFFFADSGFDSDPYPNFFGTSAAAPHAAAVATLLLEDQPRLTPNQVYDLIQTTAIDVEEPGFDFLSGAGLIDAVGVLSGQAAEPPEIQNDSELFFLHRDDVHPLDDYEQWFVQTGFFVPEEDLVSFVPNSPFGVPSPVLASNTIREGQFGIVSRNSKPKLRRNSIISPSIAGVFTYGANAPEMGNEEEPGENVIIGADNYSMINQSALNIPAYGNLWDFADSRKSIDEYILDDDENNAAGPVHFDGFLTEPPAMLASKGNLIPDGRIKQDDLQILLRNWHTMIGQSKLFGTRSFSRVDFDKNRMVDYKDLFYLSSQYGRTGLE